MEALSILAIPVVLFVMIAWLIRKTEARHMHDAERAAEEFMGKLPKRDAAAAPAANKGPL